MWNKRPWKASPFPIKLMNIFWPLKNSAKAEQAECLSLEISGKHPFPFWLQPRGKCINQKKLNVKTLSRPYTKRTHQSFHLWVCHLGMLWTQTEESNSVFQTSPIIIIVGYQTQSLKALGPSWELAGPQDHSMIPHNSHACVLVLYILVQCSSKLILIYSKGNLTWNTSIRGCEVSMGLSW